MLHGFFSLGPLNTASYNTIFLAPIATYGAGVGNNYLALARAGYDHTFGPSLMMHLGYGFNYETQNSTAPYSNVVDTFGIPNALPITVHGEIKNLVHGLGRIFCGRRFLFNQLRRERGNE